MAVVTGNPHRSVLGQIPVGEIPALPVARQTTGRFFFGIGKFLAKDKDAHSLFSALFHVGAARPMAGFAGVPVYRAVGQLFIAMNRLGEAVVVVLVTAFADLRPHDAIASPDFSLGIDSADKDENG